MDAKPMACAFVSATLASFSVAGADEPVNCIRDADRFERLQHELRRCLDPVRPSPAKARHYIIYGRYNSETHGPLVREGYGLCTQGEPAHEHYEACNDRSFIAAATAVLPEEEFEAYREAQTDPIVSPDVDAPLACVTAAGKRCAPGALPLDAPCECDGLAGTVRR